MDLLKWVLFVLAILWVVWFLTGGPGSDRTKHPFLRAPAPLDTGELYGEPFSIPGVPGGGIVSEEQKEKEENVSIFRGSFNLGTGNPYATNPNEEYIEIRSSFNNKQPTNITGWKVKSAISGFEATIGKGVYLPASGAVNREDTIFLNPGDRAVIVTGRSPNGVSFRLNACTGYFEQFQDFTPSLPQECPYVRSENLPIGGQGGLDDACVSYIESIPQCFAHISAIPTTLNANCHDYINKNIHYNGCVQNYKNDPNFYKPEWRVFLERPTELWRQNRETIKLFDAEGRLVDSLSY